MKSNKIMESKLKEHCLGLDLLKYASLSVGADAYADIYDLEKQRLESIIIECDRESSKNLIQKIIKLWNYKKQ